MNETIIAALIAAFVAVGSSLGVAVLTRPKTKAEAKLLGTSGSVAISAEIREWAQVFIDDAKEANEEAKDANVRAREADAHARTAEARAAHADERYDQLEALAIKAYGHVRKLNETITTMGGTPPALPPELEALWTGAL